MGTPIGLWLGFHLFVIALLAFDLGVLHRRARAISVREALGLSLGYVLAAFAFNAGVFHLLGARAGYEFLTGYLIEKSLSLDNIFVFVLIFAVLGTPARDQHRVLFWGIIGALGMRAILIFLGATLLEAFHGVVFLFGAFLIATGVKMLITANATPDIANNRVLAFLRRHLRISAEYHGPAFFVREAGVPKATPLFLVLVLVEITDLVFAIDSIPAIFAITRDPFIVYTSNVFAILGLRALYFALAGIIHRFHYLKYGLSLVLVVVGGKMILNGIFGEAFVPTELALSITAALILGSIALSLVRTRGEPVPEPTDIRLLTGWVPGSPERGATDGETVERR